VRDRHAEVPWRQVVSVRNRIVHAYFDLIGKSSGLPRHRMFRPWARRSRQSFKATSRSRDIPRELVAEVPAGERASPCIILRLPECNRIRTNACRRRR
jgi:hypothetical protein